MKVTARPILTDGDQRLLDGVRVRLLSPEERDRFGQLLVAQHYLKSADRVGARVASPQRPILRQSGGSIAPGRAVMADS